MHSCPAPDSPHQAGFRHPPPPFLLFPLSRAPPPHPLVRVWALTSKPRSVWPLRLCTPRHRDPVLSGHPVSQRPGAQCFDHQLRPMLTPLPGTHGWACSVFTYLHIHPPVPVCLSHGRVSSPWCPECPGHVALGACDWGVTCSLCQGMAWALAVCCSVPRTVPGARLQGFQKQMLDAEAEPASAHGTGSRRPTQAAVAWGPRPQPGGRENHAHACTAGLQSPFTGPSGGAARGS